MNPSMTALAAASCRAWHLEADAAPPVLYDPLARYLLGERHADLVRSLENLYPESITRSLRGGVVARSRYAEDRLSLGRRAQYVILGAGLDSFGWRQVAQADPVNVFELDIPSVQAWKRERLASLKWETPAHIMLVPLDLRSEDLEAVLVRSHFDWTSPAQISWLAVIPYLPVDAIEAVLRAVGRAAPGTEIVLSYVATMDYLDGPGQEFVKTARRAAEIGGEPWITFLDPEGAEALVRRCGLTVLEHLSSDQLTDRYFAQRTDSLRPYTVERLLTAGVPG